MPTPPAGPNPTTLSMRETGSSNCAPASARARHFDTETSHAQPKSTQRTRMALPGSLPGRPGRGRVRPSDGSPDLLVRRMRRRRVEDNRCGDHLAERLGWPVQRVCGGRHCLLRERPECALCRHRRDRHPWQRVAWRRRLQEHRRRQDLDQRGAVGHASYRQDPDPPEQPGYRLCGRARTRLGPEQGARGVSQH